MSIYRGMDKEDMVHMYNRILFNSEKEWNCVICRDEDWPRGWMKSEVKSEREKTNIIYKWYLEKWLSVQFSRSVTSDSLWPHGLQHARLPCPSPTPRACSNSCPLSWWHHSTISSSVIPFSSCLQSFPASGSFPVSQFFASGGQNIGVSASTCPSNEYSGLIAFRMDWFDLLAVQGTLKSLLQHRNSKASILWHSAFFIVQLSHPYMTTGKTIALIIWTFVSKVMSLLFSMLSRFVIAFVLRSKHLLISWLILCIPVTFLNQNNFLKDVFECSWFTMLC